MTDRRGLTLYPAIDLKDGACVRLRRGQMASATVFSDDPAAQARAWQEAGFSWLHVVDLDGAFAGRSANVVAVRAILAATRLPVQLGGGLRDMAGVAGWLEAGVARIILGSAAVKDPAMVDEACRLAPGRVVVGIDARAGQVATEGWARTHAISAAALARRAEQSGACAIIFTEIERDGMLEGLALAQTVQLASELSVPVIASGGVGELAHLHALCAAAAQVPRDKGGIEGVIVGRALYDGRIDPAAALAALGAC